MKWLGADPQVTDETSCNRALLEIAALNARERAINAELDDAVRSLRAAADRKRVIRGETFELRRARLADAIRSWSQQHPPEGTRTLKLEGGEIRHQAQRVTIEVDNPATYRRALDVALEAVRQTLNGLFFRRVPLGEVFDVNVMLSISKALDGVAAATITDRNLQAIGLERRQPADRVLIKPVEHALVPEQGAA